MSLLDSFTRRGTHALRSARIHTGLALGVLGVAISGCKTGEAPKAPEPAPEAAPATPAEANEALPAAAPEAANGAEAAEGAASIHSLNVNRLDGTPASLATYAGQVLLVVNTASKCGYTPQYQGLQQLHAKYSERGFAVLGFPSNDFGGQEPGTAEEIAKFCISMYDVNFPMFEKTKTIGAERSPLYALLSEAHGAPKWNFHKYLVDKRGRPVRAWPSAVEPGAPEIASAIEEQLAAR